jgi:polysaccharide export outer membrane protein
MNIMKTKSKDGVGRRTCGLIIGTLSALALAAGLVGCGNGGSSAAIPSEARVAGFGGVLSPGDEVKVTFRGAPELDTRQKIPANGRLSLPTVGDVQAAGQTIGGLQSSLMARYQPHLQDPNVQVSLENAAAGVYVSGEVLRPGRIPLDRPMTVLEAVMESGGFTRMANPKQVVLVRNQNGKSMRYLLNMNDTLTSAQSSPFYVRPYDVIYVKQSVW